MTRNRNPSAHHGPLSRAPWFEILAHNRRQTERFTHPHQRVPSLGWTFTRGQVRLSPRFAERLMNDGGGW